MAEKTPSATAPGFPQTGPPPPQEGDWPPGYVPGQGFTEPPPADLTNGRPPANAPQGPPDFSRESAVPLNQLQTKPQNINCPNCHGKHQTKMVGRSEGQKKLHNILWWPLPNRKHYWEKTFWYCSSCDHLLARQKFGKPLEVLATQR